MKRKINARHFFGKKNIKSPKVIALAVFLVLILAAGGIFLKNMITKDDNLINISDLSNEFVEEYFRKVAENNANEDYKKENLLIAISKDPIRNTYGAVDVTEAPNHQYFLQYDSEEAKTKAFRELQKDENIHIEENHKVELYNDVSEPSYNSWGIEKMGFDYISEKYDDGNLGSVSVAILDTGCDMEVFNRHFNGKIVNSYSVIDNKTGAENMYDNVGHGTHIAGTIAEATPSNVTIVPVKASDSMELFDADIINGINWIVINNAADVINMSFGSGDYNEANYVAIEAARQNNIISVVASGNEYADESSYPAKFDNTISVGAVDSNLEKAVFSNSDSDLTFSAPGVDILSLNAGSTSSETDLISMNGTSMATPHVVSAVATLQGFKSDLSLEQIIDVLKEFAIDLGPKGHDDYFGYGMIDFSSFVRCDGAENCDNLNIYKTENRIEVSPIVTEYNYGSLTNILATEVKLYLDEENYPANKLPRNCRVCTPRPLSRSYTGTCSAGARENG